MVDELPEGWRLPAIISAITQLAQVGTLIFFLGRYLAPKFFTFERAIYFIFIVGLFSCVLLSIFWNRTVKINHEDRSVYLYVFNFLLSLLGFYYFKIMCDEKVFYLRMYVSNNEIFNSLIKTKG